MSAFVHGCACMCVRVSMYVCLSGLPVHLPHWSSAVVKLFRMMSASVLFLSGNRMWCCIVLDMATCLRGIAAAV